MRTPKRLLAAALACLPLAGCSGVGLAADVAVGAGQVALGAGQVALGGANLALDAAGL